MSFASYSAAILRNLKKRRKTRPNMRLEFDYRSRQGISGVDHKEIKPLTRKEIAQLRYYLDDAKRKKRKYQFLAVLISLAALALIVFLFLELVEYLQDSPPGFFRGKDGEL